MLKYILKRIVHSVITIWAVATAVFFGMHAVPGGPARQMAGDEAPQERVEVIKEDLGLNRPVHEQYFEWMMDIITLEFGQSFRTGQSISVHLASAVPPTLSIAAGGIIIGLLIAIPTGIISATRRNTKADYIATIFAFSGISLPSFFIGILLALIVGVQLGLLPVVGYTSINEGVWPWFQSIILPSIAVGVPYAAVVMRMLRSELLEVMGSQYMVTARAKGVNSRTRLYKHALQNAMIPVVTIAGISMAVIITGSVTVEIVFGINGLGRLLVDSMLNLDYPLVQTTIVIVAAILVATNLTVDIIYTVLDPRIQYGDNNE